MNAALVALGTLALITLACGGQSEDAPAISGNAYLTYPKHFDVLRPAEVLVTALRKDEEANEYRFVREHEGNVVSVYGRVVGIDPLNLPKTHGHIIEVGKSSIVFGSQETLACVLENDDMLTWAGRKDTVEIVGILGRWTTFNNKYQYFLDRCYVVRVNGMLTDYEIGNGNN